MYENRARLLPLCTSLCGILVDVDGDEVIRVRGDQDHSFSHRYGPLFRHRGQPASGPIGINLAANTQMAGPFRCALYQICCD